MYVIFQNGGKQYQAYIGQLVRLEKLNTKIGEIIELNKVYMVSDTNNMDIGHPLLNKYKIIAKIIKHGRDKKIKIIKFHRRKHFHKLQGHRQWFTDIQILNICCY